MKITDKELKEFITASQVKISIEKQIKIIEDIKNGRFNK
jgi:hypothetical protein